MVSRQSIARPSPSWRGEIRVHRAPIGPRCSCGRRGPRLHPLAAALGARARRGVVPIWSSSPRKNERSPQSVSHGIPRWEFFPTRRVRSQKWMLGQVKQPFYVVQKKCDLFERTPAHVPSFVSHRRLQVSVAVLSVPHHDYSIRHGHLPVPREMKRIRDFRRAG